MEFAKTPRHNNKVRHNVVAPINNSNNNNNNEEVKRRMVPPFAQWLGESSKGGKWSDDFDSGVKLSRKNASPHLTDSNDSNNSNNIINNIHNDINKRNNNVSVNNIKLTTSTIISEKDGVQIVEEEEIIKKGGKGILKKEGMMMLPGNIMNEEENELRMIEEGREEGMNDESSKKTYSQHSLLSSDVDTSSVGSTHRSINNHNNNNNINNNTTNIINNNTFNKVINNMGVGGVMVPGIEMIHFNQRHSSLSNMETLDRLAELSGSRKGSILKNSMGSSASYTPKSHPSARIIREDERRVSWSDLHHGKQLTQVREVEYGESRIHRLLRQNRKSVILTSILFLVSILIIAIVLTVVNVG